MVCVFFSKLKLDQHLVIHTSLNNMQV